MTAQISDKLINKHPGINFGNLRLYAVLVGDILDFKNVKPYPLNKKGDEEKIVSCSACWQGYTSVYELSETGRLKVVAFEYPFNRDVGPDETEEELNGNFWLDMRSSFFEKMIYVPFLDGKLVEDESKWF